MSQKFWRGAIATLAVFTLLTSTFAGVPFNLPQALGLQKASADGGVEISDCETLQDLLSADNDEFPDTMNNHYVLTDDINCEINSITDLIGFQANDLGDGMFSYTFVPFTGSLNGNNYTITLNINLAIEPTDPIIQNILFPLQVPLNNLGIGLFPYAVDAQFANINLAGSLNVTYSEEFNFGDLNSNLDPILQSVGSLVGRYESACFPECEEATVLSNINSQVDLELELPSTSVGGIVGSFGGPTITDENENSVVLYSFDNVSYSGEITTRFVDDLGGIAGNISSTNITNANIEDFTLTIVPTPNAFSETDTFYQISNLGGVFGYAIDINIQDIEIFNFIANLEPGVLLDNDEEQIFGLYLENIGSIAGYALALSVQDVVAEDINIFVQSAAEVKNVGGLFGALYSSLISEVSGSNFDLEVQVNNEEPSCGYDEDFGLEDVCLAKFIGGLIGFSYESSISSAVLENVVITSLEGFQVGGFIGLLVNGIIESVYDEQTDSFTDSYLPVVDNSSVIGESEITAIHEVGGFVGYTTSNDQAFTLSNSYSTATVTGSREVGGFVGDNNGLTIYRSYSLGDVIGLEHSLESFSAFSHSRFGGFAGENDTSDNTYGLIRESYSMGNVTAPSAARVGGFVGYNTDSTIKDAFARGRVEGFSEVGGFVGRLSTSDIVSTLENVYSTGFVSMLDEDGSYIGGLIGRLRDDPDGDSESEIINSYWDVNYTGIQSYWWENLGQSATTIQLKTQSFYPETEEFDQFNLFENGTVTAERFRWVITAERDPVANAIGGENVDGTGNAPVPLFTQASEFRLINNGVPVSIVPFIINNPGGDSPEGEGVENLFDRSFNTKWIDRNFYAEEENLESRQSIVEFTFNNPVTIDGYSWATGNDRAYRDPATWELQIFDTDAQNWVVVASEEDFQFETNPLEDRRKWVKNITPQGWDFENVWTFTEDVNNDYPHFGYSEPANIDQGDPVNPTGPGGGGDDDDDDAPVVNPPTSRSGGSGGGSTPVAQPPQAESGTRTYQQEIAAAFEKGIYTKEPTNNTNKCEALVMMSRVFAWKVPAAETSKYTDIPEWCISVAAYATDRGIVEGRTETTLGLETPVSRFEVAVMLYRELQRQGYQFGGDILIEFSDEIVDWALEAVQSLVSVGIIKGFEDGSFGGNLPIIKQDLGVMLIRI